MRQFEATVHGRVQGVSFRYYTRQEAQRLDVKGWVANHHDGTVRVVAQGSELALNQFGEFLHRGPSMARVERVDLTWVEPTEIFTHFRVTYL